MTIVFDLDYTLYDTLALKGALVSALVGLGYDRARAEQGFAGARGTSGSGIDYYRPEGHAAAMHASQQGIADEGATLAALRACLAEGQRFLYPGVWALLTRLRSLEHRLVLLTLGDDAWQRAKVVGAGLDVLFHEVRTTLEDKERVIPEYAHIGAELAVINDNVAETMRMRAAAPSAYYIIKKGPKGVPGDCDLPVAETIEAIGRLLHV